MITELQLVLPAWVYCLIRFDITEQRRVTGELQHRGELLEAAKKELESFSCSLTTYVPHFVTSMALPHSCVNRSSPR